MAVPLTAVSGRVAGGAGGARRRHRVHDRPVGGTGTEGGGQSVVYLDRARARMLYRALRSDTVDEYVAKSAQAVNEVDEVR